MNKNSSTRKGLLFASFTALLWGFLAIVLKLSLNGVTPITVVWFRFALAFALLFIYYLIRKPSALKILIKPPVLIIFAAICLGFNYLGFISGINLTTPGIAQIFIQLGPVLLAVSGFILFKERMSVRQLLGLLMVVIGLSVFYREQIIVLASDIAVYQKGVLWIIFGAIMWASYAVIQKIMVSRFNPMELNLILFGLPALGYLPFIKIGPVLHSSPFELSLLAFLGVNTLLAYGSIAFAFKYAEANKISVIVTLNPIITFTTMGILGVMEVDWIAHEKITLTTIAGALIVISGAVLTVLRKKT